MAFSGESIIFPKGFQEVSDKKYTYTSPYSSGVSLNPIDRNWIEHQSAARTRKDFQEWIHTPLSLRYVFFDV